MIEYLYKQYPDQAKDATRAGEEIKTDSIGKKSVVAAASSQKKADDSGDDSGGDEDDVADLPEPVKMASAGRVPASRRVSVSAESVDPNKLKAQMSQVAKIDKSPEVAARLEEVVRRSPLLSSLDSEQRQTIIRAFAGPVLKGAGEVIIQQGDTGDVFYLLEEGLVDIFVSKQQQPAVKVHTLTAGNSFGELALMYNAPRAATCRAQSACKLWTLDRVSFKVIVVAAAMQKREAYSSFLRQVSILSTLSEMEINVLADCLREEQYNAGAVVFNQGEAGEHFYIIKQGAISCTQKDSNGADKVVASLSAGDYFGEIALLNSSPRQATVTAREAAVLLSVDKSTFVRIMGPLEELLKRNMAQYAKFSAPQTI